ncbi:MBL fold metallo-hydrolase [Paenibacillus chartarius]|uniref:MBL fold metallo-hydrolase n=1 Tax=Paenibacillus chartarius TaxID=747481 RepID=A0ABV6DJ24_9BACL
MQQVIEHEGGAIVQVKVPLPFPLRWVNGYVVKGKNGLTIIDPGLHTPEAETCWDDAMRLIGCTYTDIERIVLTHYHPDHYGLAGWMQDRSGGAPVWMSGEGVRLAQFLWGEGTPMTPALTALFREHGMDDELCAQIRVHMDDFVPLVSPQPRTSLLEPGDTVRLGDDEYTAILTPGHAAGHLCLYRAEDRRIFCGDHVLPQISPNVSWMPGVEDNPLDAFLSSLKEVAGLDVGIAYPGHREPFSRFAERALELVDHHQERLALMLSKLSVPCSAFAVCREVFGERLTVHQLRFALAETLAHLVYLERSGQAVCERSANGIFMFRAAAAILQP